MPRWLFFYFLSFAACIGYAVLMIFEPIFALERLGATPLQLGLLGTGSLAAYAVVALFAGWISDRSPARRWMLLGLFSLIVAALLLPRCRELNQFLPLAIARSALGGLFWSPMMGLLSKSTPPARLSRALGVYNVSWATGSAVGALVAGRFYDRLGPAAPFYFAAAIFALSFLIVLAGKPPVLSAAAPEPLPSQPLAGGFKVRAWIALVLGFLLISMTVYTFPKQALAAPFSLSAEEISRLHALRQFAMIAAFAFMGISARWHFRAAPLHACFVLMIIFSLMVAAARHASFFYPAFAALGATVGIGYSLAIYYGMMSPRAKGSMMGVHEALLAAGEALGPIFGGMVIDLTGRPAMPFWLILPPLLIGWCVVTWMQRRRARDA